MNNLCEKHNAALKQAAIKYNLPIDDSISIAIKNINYGLNDMHAEELKTRVIDCPVCFAMQYPCDCGEPGCSMPNAAGVENELINTNMQFIALTMINGEKQ